MEITSRAIEDLKPYEKNAKKHSRKQIGDIAKSIKKFGWSQPIVIDESGTIIIGHGRYLAAEKLKLKEIPCVLMSDLTEEEIKALRLLDNKLNESPWDVDLLATELEGADLEAFSVDWDISPLEGTAIATEGNKINEDWLNQYFEAKQSSMGSAETSQSDEAHTPEQAFTANGIPEAGEEAKPKVIICPHCGKEIEI